MFPHAKDKRDPGGTPGARRYCRSGPWTRTLPCRPGASRARFLHNRVISRPSIGVDGRLERRSDIRIQSVAEELIDRQHGATDDDGNAVDAVDSDGHVAAIIE